MWAVSQLQQRNRALLLQAQIPWSNVWQVVHVSPTSSLSHFHKKLTSYVVLLRQLAGSCRCAGATTLRTATLALVYSTTEYCAPVWCRSARTHLIDPAINNALQIVSGCLWPIPANNRPNLAGIQPVELHCNGATLSLACRAIEPGQLLQWALTRPLSSDARHLKSRHPFVPTAQQRVNSSDNNNIRVAHWADHKCGVHGQPHKTSHFHPWRQYTPRSDPSKKSLCLSYCLRTSVEHFCSCLCKCGMASSAACECGAEEQTIDHLLQCPLHWPPHGLHGLMILDDKTIEWLLNTCPKI